MPPSNGDSSGPTIEATQVNRSLSDTGEALTPGGQSVCRDFRSDINLSVAARMTSGDVPAAAAMVLLISWPVILLWSGPCSAASKQAPTARVSKTFAGRGDMAGKMRMGMPSGLTSLLKDGYKHMSGGCKQPSAGAHAGSPLLPRSAACCRPGRGNAAEH